MKDIRAIVANEFVTIQGSSRFGFLLCDPYKSIRFVRSNITQQKTTMMRLRLNLVRDEKYNRSAKDIPTQLAKPMGVLFE